MKVLATVLSTLLLAASLGGCQLGDSQPKSAVINTREVVTKCNDGIRVVTEIQKQFADRQDQLKAQDEALAKARQTPTTRKDDLQAMAQKLVADSQQLRKDVGEAEAAKFKPIVDKINKALAEYAKEHGLLSVQDKNGFAYIDPSIDITQEIIKRVDQMH